MNVIIIRTTLGNKPRQGVDCNNERIDLSECAGQSARHPETNTPRASTISEMSMFAVVSTRCHKYSNAYRIFLELIRSPPLPHTRTKKQVVLDDLFWVVFWKERGTKKRKQKKNIPKNKFWEPTLGWGKGRRLSNAFLFLIFFCFFQLFWLFSMGPSPKSLLFLFFVFPMFILVFSMGPSPKNLKICFFSVFQPKGLPKGQMVAMTMNVLKWRPKFGLCFGTFSLTCLL